MSPEVHYRNLPRSLANGSYYLKKRTLPILAAPGSPQQAALGTRRGLGVVCVRVGRLKNACDLNSSWWVIGEGFSVWDPVCPSPAGDPAI
jgi:hypothetical protein